MDLQESMVIKGIWRIHLHAPKTFTRGHVSVFDKYLHWPHVNVSVKKKTKYSKYSKKKLLYI
jgi:hypothetical protein